MQSQTNAVVNRQFTRLVNATSNIRNWLDANGITPVDYAVYPCPCCNDIVLSYQIEISKISRFEQREREFWDYVRTQFPLHERLEEELSGQYFEPLFSARLDDEAAGEWTLVVQPCASTYGVEFPPHEFWAEVNSVTSGEARLVS